MRLVLLTAYVGYVGLFRWLSPSAYIALKVLFPVLQLSFFTLLGTSTGRDPTFYIVGNAIAVAPISAVFALGRAVGEERSAGLLPYLVTSPANHLQRFLPLGIVYVLDGLASSMLALLWGALVFGVQFAPASVESLLVVIAIGTLAAAGLGLLVGACAYVLVDTALIGNLSLFLILLVSGANVPLNDLPGPLLALAWALPLTRSITAARALQAGGTLVEVWPLMFSDLVVGVGYAAVAFVIVRWAEFHARITGSLERV